MNCVHCGDTGSIQVVHVVIPEGEYYWGPTPPYNSPCDQCPQGFVLAAVANVIGEANEF